MFALDSIGKVWSVFSYFDMEGSTMKFLYKDFTSSAYLLIVWCYLLGLITHKVVESLTLPIHIKTEDNSKKCHEKKEKNRSCIKEFLCFLIDVIVSPFWRNKPSIIKRSREYAKTIYPDAFFYLKCWLHKDLSNKQILEEYYNAYYTLQKADKLGNIPKVEAHSAFLKDFIFVWTLLLIGFCANRGNTIGMLIVRIVIEMLLLWARYYCEFKIHYLIWEVIVQYYKNKEKEKEKEKKENH